MEKKSKILIAALDWGLGHASRCIPLIERYISDGHEVVLASNGRSAALLEKRFPQLFVRKDIPDYAIEYPGNGSMSWHFFKNSIKILAVIRDENRWLQDVIHKEKFDEIISDNRYGLYSELVPCRLITHQLFIRGPWIIEPLLHTIVKKYITRFTECLVPDYEDGKTLSGELSHAKNIPPNVRYIGPLSRFSGWKPSGEKTIKSNFAIALISGPEPQRTKLQNRIIQLFQGLNQPCIVLCGQPEKQFDQTEKNVRLISHCTDEELIQLIQKSEHIVCRSGYSTIMDLHALGRRAILIPTAGQTEQEYLAQYHSAQGNHKTIAEREIDGSIFVP